MKSKMIPLTSAFCVLALLSACDDNNDSTPTYIEKLSFDLAQPDALWQSGFADYPVGGETEWELEASANAPFTLADGTTSAGYKLHSHNRSDDTQMYVTRKFGSLMPNTHYNVKLSASFASNVNGECVGIGGAPHAVTVKAGLSIIEPSRYVDELVHYRLNIDTGNQTNGGLDMQSLSNIANNTLADCDPGSDIFAEQSVNNDGALFEVTTDDSGELWVTLLTDSGFEGPTTLYFTGVDIEFTPSEKNPNNFTQLVDFTVEQPSVSAVFFDYPVGREGEWELTAEPQSEVTLISGESQSGYLLHSYNRSDDTGMMLTLPVKGLLPNSTYKATFNATVATNVNPFCSGIGGAPHAVSVKAGVANTYPHLIIDDIGHYRVNLDIGNNMSEGENAVRLGDIGLDALDDCDPSSTVYGLKTFNDIEKTLTLNTDDNSGIYFYVFTDSGFEGPTTMLFTEASLTVTKQ
ncbi:hypothetical protein ACFSJY_08000 [Thalassotalea euphylliae]|uniref:hypothetical protein n=1 Tax=Thalassotalea euphylliae TaxID=1655234 RepID=UPI003624EEE9